ncbi:MAG TPA: ATP-binding protein [Oligoflexus sp.]|uniref:ATP-binding protein n=1 Tax=Oligoflexus sp. TaxID=1971216 RepID=UPI002D801B7B|nr:ATP-binding protein [Oligoflexus sp.]HET9239419.1 ATP-binding protein [Oligoflexus sp.]
MRDESQLRAIQRFAKQQAQRVELLQEKLQEILAGKPSLMRQLLKQIAEEWKALQDGPETATLRRLHTFKGAARTLGLKELAGQIHEMESRVAEATEAHWNQLGTVLADYDHLLNSLMASRTEDSCARDLYAYASLYAEEASRRLQAGQRRFQGVRVLDQIRHWDEATLQQIHEIILHSVANAVDHGFLRAQGSSEPALIEIEAIYQEQAIQLVIADNGQGIDMNFVATQAQARGFVPEPGRPLTDILFCDGLSTASSVSETSGRGVGLSAIQSICRALQATPEIRNRSSGGTQLSITLPLK